MEHLHIIRSENEIPSTKSFHSVGSEEEVALNGHHSSLDPPMAFFFGGVVKNKVYEKNPKTVNKLKDCSHDAIREIDENPNLYRTVCQSVLNRCEECCNVSG